MFLPRRSLYQEVDAPGKCRTPPKPSRLCAAKLIFPHFSSSGFYWAIKRGLSEQQRSSGPPVLNLSFKNLFSVADLYPGPTLEGKFVFFGGFVCLQTFCGMESGSGRSIWARKGVKA
jgi:hypothetical protein